MTALLLDRAQTRAALDPAALLPLLRRALIAIGDGSASAPARIAAFSPQGLLGAMPGYVPGLGMAGKLTTVFPRPGGGSAHRGVVLLADPEDGRPLAVLDAEPLTALRTAATATVAMQALATPDPQHIAVIGAGAQARAQLQMLAAIGCRAQVVVVSRHDERAAAAAAVLPGASAARSVAEAVERADVVFCCTDAVRPVLDLADLGVAAGGRPVHVSSVGGSHGPELGAELIAAGVLFAEWSGAVTAAPPAGAHELQGLDPNRVTLLGAVLAGTSPATTGQTTVTVFKSTGHAALDVAAAVAARDRALALGIGSQLDI